MNELIKISYDGELPTVSARDLHEALEIKTAWKDWFPRMCDYGFTEGIDYSIKWSELKNEHAVPFEKSAQYMASKGYSMDADMTVEMGKQICMIQRTDKGKQYRQYFLDLEKAWNTPEQIMARALKMAEAKISDLKQRTSHLEIEVKAKDQMIGELKPKADYTSLILDNKGLVTITQIAKDYGMSGQALNELLHKLGIQYKQSEQWLLYAKYHSMGYTHSKTVNITHSDGTPDIRMNTKWTQKGRLFLYELLKQNGYLPIIEQK